jgi:MFS family permease
MATGIGAAAAFPLVAMLMRRLGSRRLSLLSAFGLTLLLIPLSVMPNYPVALLIMGVDGVLVACLNVAMNAQGAALEAAHRRNAMAKLHATFSGGSLGAALLASGMNSVTSTVAVHFCTAAVLLLLLTAYARSGLLTQEQATAASEPATAITTAGADTTSEAGEVATAVATAVSVEKKAKNRGKWTVPTRMTLWMGGAMAFGTITEGAMNDWSAIYMKDVAKASSQLAPMGIAVVSVMMVLARLFADGWRSRWGDGLIVRAGSALAGAGLALALLSGGIVPALIGFAAVGLGIAAVTPCVYVAAAGQGSDALTLVATMGTTGLLAGPPVIGFIANASGLVWGLGAVAASAIVVSLCSTQIRWTTTA